MCGFIEGQNIIYDEGYDEGIRQSENEINRLNNEIDEKNKLIDTILEFGIFMDECTLNFIFDYNSIQSKAQNVFYEDSGEWCEKKCNECYKKCWLKYFKEIQRLEENK